MRMQILTQSLFFALSCFASTLAQAEAAAGTSWQSSCADGLCTLSRTLADQTSGRNVATILVVVQKSTSELRLGAALPLGVALEPGIRFTQGDTLISARFEVCFPDGCRAMTALPSAAFDALVASPAMDMLMFPFGQDRPVAIEVPLDELAASVAAARETIASTP